jgi:glycerol-3-phosphate acyltransferase PlsY
MDLLLLSAIGYFIGSIPSGFLLTKFKNGVDLREFGSGSTGATNVLRTGDKRLAFFTLALDVVKGAVVSACSANVADAELSDFIPCLCCMIGHVYPVWLRFKGGKGVATAAGICLILSPIASIIAIVIWGVVAKITKISSIASISFIGSFVVITAYRFLNNGVSQEFCIFVATVFALIVCTHFRNITNLIYQRRA